VAARAARFRPGPGPDLPGEGLSPGPRCGSSGRGATPHRWRGLPLCRA
jgi:hypothetical protein